MSAAWAQAFALVFDPYTMLVMLGASLFGLFVGAIPGLTATMATALLVPITFFMPPIAAIAAMVTATAMAIFSGDIPGCLMRMPGTPASAAYTDEAYALTRKGQAELALGAGLVFSAIGGLFGTAVLIVAAPSLAEFALKFSSYEYFWLVLLGLTCAVFMTSGAAFRIRAYWGAYAVTKAALEVLARTYAAETERTNVRVNLFNPGATRTRMRATAMPGEDPMTLPTPEEVAETVVPLCLAEFTETGRLYDYRSRKLLSYQMPA